MLDQLIKLSKSLDELGLYEEASNIESLINSMISNNLYPIASASSSEDRELFFERSATYEVEYEVMSKLANYLQNNLDKEDISNLADTIKGSLGDEDFKEFAEEINKEI